MNAYYHNNRTNNSNNDIFRDMLLGKAQAVPSWKRNADTVLSFLAAMLAVLASATARRVYRAVSFTVILLAIVLLVAAVEGGAIGIGTAILISLPLLALEYLCLRKQ